VSVPHRTSAKKPYLFDHLSVDSKIQKTACGGSLFLSIKRGVIKYEISREINKIMMLK
jgi:hypothetical protein